MEKARIDFYSRKFARALTENLSPRLKRVLAVFKNYHCNRLLDIGCGDGSFTILLKNFSNEVYGVDIAQEAAKLANRRGIKAYSVSIDSEDLPFGESYFDAVFCGDVIEHLYDPDHLLDEIYRVLGPGGLCVITTPNLASWYNRILLMLGFQPHFTEISLRYNLGKVYVGKTEGESLNAVGGHIRLFTSSSLEKLLQIHGLNTEMIIGASTPEIGNPLISLFEKVLAHRASLSSYLIFVAKKRQIDMS